MQTGTIVKVGHVADSGAIEIDAKGLLVAPGFVDVDTHYDGQAIWDRRLMPSSWLGVTTAVMGNCGVGFAPVTHNDQKQLLELMEGVEDTLGGVFDKGLAWWKWESFGDYMDALQDMHRDVCAQFAHGPLRLYVMNERATRMEAATLEDIRAMRALTCDAMKQGALGFSTSRMLNHRSVTGGPTLGLGASLYLGDPPNYQPAEDSSIAHEAARQNRSPEDVAYDLSLKDGDRNFLFGAPSRTMRTSPSMFAARCCRTTTRSWGWATVVRT